MSNPTRQQEEAITARGAVLLTAGAGTGKTATLVNRCVRLVTAENVGVEELLVVTFTNAAAAEMKQRLREALQERSAAEPGNDRLRQQLLLLEGAHISTIHSFCLDLIRSHFTELGLDPGVSVLDDSVSAPLAHEVAREVVAEAITRPAVGRLAENYFGGDGERLIEQILKAHEYFVKQADASGLIAAHRGTYSQAEPGQWRGWREAILKDWISEWQPKVRRQALESIRGLEPLLAEHGEHTHTHKGIQNLLEYLPGFAARFSGITPESGRSEMHDLIRETAEQMGGTALWVRCTGEHRGAFKQLAEEAAELVTWLPGPGGDPLDAEWGLVREPMQALLELTETFGGRFAAAKSATGGVDFADLEQLALKVLADAGIAAQWRKRFKHVFVDECQDINGAQDQLLQTLSHHDERANLFMVGDVKQSIYRFRMAEPRLFRDHAREWAGNQKAHHQVLPLNENFRSREGIIAFANDLFGCLMGARLGGVGYDGLQFALKAAGKRAHLSLTPPADNQPEGEWNDPVCRVELHLVDSKAGWDEGEGGGGGNGGEEGGGGWGDLLDMDKQAGVAAARLLEMERGGHQVWDRRENAFRKMKWSDVGILMRSVAGRVGSFRREFLRQGIPLVAEQGDFLGTLEAQDLTALLRVLDNPQQDIPLFAVLRSPLAGFTLDELVVLRPRDRKTGWERITQARGDERASRFVNKITQWRRLALMTSLTAVLETVLTETRYEAYLLTLKDGADRVANVRRFLELARRYDPLQRQGLRRFLRYIDDQQEEEREISPLPPRQPDAVQLMSIHKSKGLEFPIVVVASIGSKFNQADLNEGILFTRGWGIAPQVVDPGNHGRRDSLIRWQARRDEKKEMIAEELRLFYVAVTRARDSLLLVGSFNPGSKSWAEKLSQPPETGIPRAMSYCEWICLWLGGPDCGTDEEGVPRYRAARPSPHVRWKVHDKPVERAQSSPPPGRGWQLDEAQLKAFDWSYPHEAATRAAAKTSASALRRMAALEDEDTSALPGPDPAFQADGPLTRGRLTAAQRGTAHHVFLEHLDLACASDMGGLETELERIRARGWISEAEARSIDLGSLLKFWQSGLGREIIGNKSHVRKELKFTAGFTPREMADHTGQYGGMDESESVILQGAVDLAVILADEIWIVDFKTDQVTLERLAEKGRTYEMQLRLYAAALGKIYGRRTTKAALYFLKPGEFLRII